MKRKMVMGLAMMLIGLQLIGCADQTSDNTKEEASQEVTVEEGTDSSQTVQEPKLYFKDVKLEDNVVLGEYKGLKVISNVVTVTEEDVEEYIQYMLSMSQELKEVTDRDVIKIGDVANIDYVGKKDGVAFEGGTAEGYDLGIGSGSFIDGFEEGLIGVKKGETVDLNLTFPEEYHSEDLAGAEVVFTVTVNGIYEEVTPEFTDEYVVGLGIEDVTTCDEYRAYLKNMMEESEKEYAANDVQAQIISMVADNATVESIPQELIDKFYNVNINNMSYQAMMYGMDLESFVSAYYGMDAEAFEAQAVESAEISAKQAMVCLAIAKEEEIVVTEEEVDAAAEESYLSYGYGSAEEFKSAIDLEEYKDSLLLNKVVDFLQENATITEVQELAE